MSASLTMPAAPEVQNDLLLANPIAGALYNDINACEGLDQLDAVTKLLWERYGAGQLNDDEASYLQSCVERRRPLSRRTKLGKFAALRSPISRYTPRPCRRRLTGEERAERHKRKRRLGGSSAMPDTMRDCFTEGERAVGCIVAGEVKRYGECTLSIDEIADRAGVGPTTVRNYQHQARLLGHISVQERPRRGAKHLTNIIRITSSEWLAWIKRGPNAAHTLERDRLQKSKNLNASKNIDSRKKEAFQGKRCTEVPKWQRRRRERDRELDHDEPVGGGFAIIAAMLDGRLSIAEWQRRRRERGRGDEPSGNPYATIATRLRRGGADAV